MHRVYPGSAPHGLSSCSGSIEFDGAEMSVSQAEEGASGGRDARRVPGERRAPLQARAGYPHDGEVGSLNGRARNDCDAESFAGELDE
jgi:hypothetical protein